MGRRKIEMKRIEKKSTRQVTFSKRRSGLMKKANELSVLCDVDIAVVVFSSRGRLYESFSGTSSLSQVLENYQGSTTADGNASANAAVIGNASANAHHIDQHSLRYSEIRTCAELVEIVERELDGRSPEHLSVDDFMQLEEQLSLALLQTRNKKSQLMLRNLMSLEDQERTLKQENEQLSERLTKEVAKIKAKNKNQKQVVGLCQTSGKNNDGKQMGLEFESLANTQAGCPPPPNTLLLLP